MKEAQLLLNGHDEGEITAMKDQFKVEVKNQMEDDFVSSGTIQSFDKKATIRFLRRDIRTDDKSQNYVKINAEDYKPLKPRVRPPVFAEPKTTQPILNIEEPQ